MIDQRVGAAVRALRRRRGWRQIDLAAAARVSQALISLIERGHLDGLQLRTLRSVLAVLDAQAEIDFLWRGGQVDRLLDERHARLVEAIVRGLRGAGWEVRPEVTYQRYGERGSVDVVGYRLAERAALVVEAKVDIMSVEETNRRFAPKIRLAPIYVREQLGFTPTVIGAVLAVPDTTTARRRVADHEATFAALYPGRTRDVGRWLQRLDRDLRAIWFVPDIAPGSPGRRIPGPTRIVRPRSCVASFAG